MGKQTSAAIFVSIREIDKFSAAAIPQHIQRAIAEQTIKIFWVGTLMTGEIFTFPIAEIFHSDRLAGICTRFRVTPLRIEQYDDSIFSYYYNSKAQPCHV